MPTMFKSVVSLVKGAACTVYFFYQLLFINNYRSVTITFYGHDAAGMNSFMGLDQDVKSCISLYHNILVLSCWPLLE